MADSTTPPSTEVTAPQPGPVLAVACSGGRDSMALLHHAVRRLRERIAPADGGLMRQAPQALWVLHVHHGLMAEADAWWAFVEREVAAWQAQGLPVHFKGERLRGRPAVGDSVEAWAREQRYAALARMAVAVGAHVVWLAQHRRDQAETVLLQALRGAGVAGLAAMPAAFDWQGMRFERPWLERSREAIDAEVQRLGLAHVDDSSNGDKRFARNRVRLEALPVLKAVSPSAEEALCDVAQQAADALAVQQAWYQSVRRQVLALQPAETAQADADLGAVCLEAWRRLPGASFQRVFLRLWMDEVCVAQGWPAVGRAPLLALVQGLARQGEQPARSWSLGQGVHAREYRGLLSLTRDAQGAGLADAWQRLQVLPAPLNRAHAAGTEAEHSAPSLPRAALDGAQWRWREGGERFRMGPGRPSRCLRKQFQSQGVPAWAREAPLLWSADGCLLFVPGLGIEGAAQALPGADRVALTWQG
ncbi:tRNA lysidine(34) synthetase TilS [Aquabacterium lacunae]|uniref:tRNA(Ile)-lysidine synthase n=1 Tax=Aquabacterium lacunae TaxID=2528630 RepID=A0A4V2JFE1_9BURK|nr:tRNA lysidine(34) synthetase TilS [Aquabacterium lacunae]